jgi:hypothetical protein
LLITSAAYEGYASADMLWLLLFVMENELERDPMATLSEKPVRLLMYDMAASMGLVAGQSFSREQAVQWFAANYPNVKQGTVAAHLIRLSTNVPTRLQYSPRADGSDDISTRSIARTFDYTNQDAIQLQSRN